MQLSDVTSILGQHTGADKTLTLPANAFGEDTAVAGVITAYCTGGSLVVTNAVRVTTDTAVTVQGTGGSAPFTGMAVQARFTVDGTGAVVLALVATAPASGWTLATAFPVLEPTLAAGLAFTGSPGFYLGSANTDLAALGLHFKGTLPLDGALENFRWLLGGAATLDVEGPVEIHQGVPEMTIGAEVTGGVTLGWFALRSVRLDVVSRLRVGVAGRAPIAVGGGNGGGGAHPVRPAVTAAADACFRLSSEVAFQSGQTDVRIPIAAEFYASPGTWVAFEADLNDAVFATIDALTALVDGYPLGSLLAEAGHTLEENVRLSQLVIQVDPTAQTVNSVSVGVRSARPWVLARGTVGGVEDAPLLAVTALELVFRVFDPTDAAARAGALFAFGTVGVAGASMEVSAMVGSALGGDGVDVVVSGELGPGDGVDLAAAVGALLRHPVPDAPALRLSEFAFEAEPGKGIYGAAAEVTSDWTIPIGPVAVVVRDVYGRVEYDGTTASGAIGGLVTVGGATVKMDWAIPGDLQLSGVVPEIDVKALVTEFSSDSLAAVAGAFPAVTLTDTHLYVVRSQNGGAFVAAGTTVSSFGTFEVAFQQVQGRTGFVFGFALPPDWTFSQLLGRATPLDALTFHQASLVVASYTDPAFRFRRPDAPDQPIAGLYAPDGVVRGALLHAELRFADAASGPVALVGKLLPDTVTGLTLDAELRADDYTKTSFRARLDGAVRLIGQDLGSDHEVSVTARNLSLTATPLEAEADLHLELQFVLYGDAARGTNTLVLAGDIEVAGTEALVRVATQTPWVEPFGIRGLTLGRMGMAFTLGAQVRLTLAGEVILGSGSSAVTLEAAAEFNLTAEGVPDALKVHEAGTVNLGLVVAAFVGSGRVPDDLRQIELYAFDLLAVANPAGWTNPLDNRHYPAGLAFAGSLRFFGLVGKFGLQVSYETGLYATGVIQYPVRIGRLTLASQTDPTRGPSVTLNTGASPYLTLDASLSFYELRVDTFAQIASGAFVFRFSASVAGLGTLRVSATLTGGRVFAFNARLTFAFDETLTIRVTSNRTLCTLRLQVVLAGEVWITAGPGALVSLRLAADFTLDGYRIVLPDTRFAASLAGLTSLSTLPSFFAHTLGDQLWTIGRALLQDVDAFFSYAAREVNAAVHFAEDVASVLANDYRVALDKAGYLLKSVSSQMRYDATKVAELLEGGYNAAAHAVAVALRDAEYAAQDVATALHDAFAWSEHKAEEEIAAVLRAAGYGLDEIAGALRGAFGWAADEVASFFKKSWHVADTLVHEALQGAGYAVSAIEDAMKSVFGWVSRAFTSVKDTVKKW